MAKIHITMRPWYLFLILAALSLALSVSCSSNDVNGTGGEQTLTYPPLSDFVFGRPLEVMDAGDGTERLFIAIQEGYIFCFSVEGDTVTPHTFLDIHNRFRPLANEQGLLGLAFHPHYEQNGYFYVNYTAFDPERTVVSRFSVSAIDPDSADVSSEFVLLEVDQPYSNHNGGCIRFGPDGYLYIAMGDGGGAGDPLGNGQNRTTLLGSLLRIDVDTPSNGLNYSIPPDNPFVGNSDGYREEIYAYGLRNPWRFSFDFPTGRLWLGDVGQATLEEIDIIEKGRNYGWNSMEGTACFNPSTGCDTTGLTLPLWEYGRTLGYSVTGGYVYRGSEIPWLVGDYVYADYGTGRIWALRYNGVDPPVNTELTDTPLNIASFGIDGNNELYICAFDGKIYLLKNLVSG